MSEKPQSPREGRITDPNLIARVGLVAVGTYLQGRGYDADCDWRATRDEAIRRLERVGDPADAEAVRARKLSELKGERAEERT